MTEVVKKKRVNSKAKGSSGELKICKILAEHLAPLKFIRTPGSGARIGGSNFKTFGNLYSQAAMEFYVGDVVASNETEVDMKFRFVIENKCYKDAEKLEVLLNGKTNILKWLEEANIDCVKVEKEACLTFKWNNTPVYCAFNKGLELPEEVNRLTLPNGVKVCHLLDLLQYKDFWLFTSPQI
jgi:hypothetical protein